MNIIIVLLVLILIYHVFYKPIKNSPIYLNVNMSDVCKKIDNLDKDDDKKQNLNKNNKEDEMRCENQLFDIKQKYNQLKLKTDDPEPNDISYLFYDNSRYNIKDDDGLTMRMMEMGKKNKQAIINRAMWNKNSLLPYFEDELRMHSESIWYDNDLLEKDF